MAPSCSVLLIWILCVLGLAAQDQRPSQQLDLAGHWQVNEALSDEVPLLPGEALALARAAGTVRGGTRRARMVRGPDPQQLTRVRNALHSAIHAAEQLKIVQARGVVTLTDGDGRTFSVTPGGNAIQLEQDGVEFTIMARWNAPLLTIEREYEDGTKLTESFASFDQPRQLVATSTIHNSGMAGEPVTLRRVYEIVAQGGSRPR